MSSTRPHWTTRAASLVVAVAAALAGLRLGLAAPSTSPVMPPPPPAAAAGPVPGG